MKFRLPEVPATRGSALGVYVKMFLLYIYVYGVPFKDCGRLTFDKSSSSVGLLELLMSMCSQVSLGYYMLCTILYCIQWDMMLTWDHKVPQRETRYVLSLRHPGETKEESETFVLFSYILLLAMATSDC